MEAVGVLLLCCVLVSVPSSSVSGDNFPEIDSIDKLADINFGHRFPRHGLKMLYFIVKKLNIDNNGVIRPDFNPPRGDYGFHYFSNYESVFPTFTDQNSYAYYAVGNLNYQESNHFDEYVTQDFINWSEGERNMDRIVVRVTRNQNVINELYITQHYPSYNRGSAYDPDNTYRLTTGILRAIQNECSLSVFLSHAGYSSRTINYCLSRAKRAVETTAPFRISQTWVCSPEQYEPQNCNFIKLDIKTTGVGLVRIKWDNIPLDLRYRDLRVALYSQEVMHHHEQLGIREYGIRDTGVRLNPGLQLRLETNEGSVIMKSALTDDCDGKIPVDIPGYDAGVILYNDDSYAGARLYIQKSFTNWKDIFENSWVGFYASANLDDKDYSTYQWAIEFNQGANTINDYYVYYYVSSMDTQPFAQARFFLSKNYRSLVSTQPWES